MKMSELRAFRTPDERIWHLYQPPRVEALCGATAPRTPGTGTVFAAAEVKPRPQCQTCKRVVDE